MDLSEELARRYVLAKQAAAGDTGADTSREEFEDLSARERVARGQAVRYKDIARGRAREEAEKTPAETFTGRLYPVPHTLGEAAWRAPAVIGGGVLGYQAVAKRELPGDEQLRELLRAGEKTVEKAPTAAAAPGLGSLAKRMETTLTAQGHPSAPARALEIQNALLKDHQLMQELATNPAVARPKLEALFGTDHAKLVDLEMQNLSAAGDVSELRKALEPSMAKGVKGKIPVEKVSVPGVSDFGQRLRERLTDLKHSNPEKAALEVERMMREKPEMIKSVLGWRPDALMGEQGLAMRGGLAKEVGELGGRKPLSLLQEVLHDSAVKGKTGLGEGLSKWKRYGGAGLGGLAAVLATGVPLGAYALWKRREGGEDAARAKARMQEELSKADDASRQREEILARLGT